MEENNSAKDSAKMDKEFISDLPKVKWRILDLDKAKEAKLKLVDINEDTTYLEMSLNDIPNGMTVVDWIEMLLRDGIIFKEPKNELRSDR